MPFEPSSAAKYVLLVERVDGRLNDLGPSLKRLGFQVVRAAETQAVSGLLRSLRRLSLVMVNGDTLKGDALALHATIKQLHPALPLAWLVSDAGAARALGSGPELVSDDLKKLEEWLTRRVREELYSPRLIQKLLSGFQNVLTALGLPARAAEPTLRVSLGALAEVNALMFLFADSLSGYLVVSASEADLGQAYRAQFPKAAPPRVEELEDLLGEAASQMVGELRRQVDIDGLTTPFPHFVRGAGAQHRHKAGAPSLAVEFSKREQKLNLELCLHRRDGSAIRAGELASWPAGELTVL